MTTGLGGFLDQYGNKLAMLNTLAAQQVALPSVFSDDPASAFFYLYQQRSNLIASVNQRPLLRLWDENMSLIGTVGQEQSVTVEEVMADSGSGSCVIRQDNWLSNFILYDRRAEQDLHFTLDPNPTNRSWETRWGGKVTTVNAKRDSSGLHHIELELISNREHLKHLLVGANPVFPPEIQVPQMYFCPFNCRTAVGLTLFINLARQFFPLLSIPDNIFNPFGWIGVSDVLGGLDPMLWPIQIQFIDALTDQSRFEILAARWNDAHTVTLPIMTDAGVIARAYTYIAGEDTVDPNPELTGLLGGIDPILPQRNCVFISLQDKSGVGGPTSTLLDGWLNWIASTGDDLITDTLIPDPDIFPDSEVPSGIYPLIETWFGVAPKPPWVIFKDDQYSGIIESTRSQHGATAKTIMTGGRSPGWLNDLQTFLIKWGLSQIQVVYGGGPAFGGAAVGGPPPLGAGLSEIYQGEADNTLFAYERFSDPVRELYCGDFGFLEHWEAGSGTAYTVAGILSLRDGDWKTRAWTSFKTTVKNGYPYLLDTDFTLGDRLGFTMAQVIYVDQLYAFKRSYDRNKAMLVELQVGSGLPEQDPLFQATNSLAAVWNMVGMFMGSEQLF